MTRTLDLDEQPPAPPEPPSRPGSPRAGSGRSRALSALLRVGLLPVLLVAAVVIFSVVEPRFLTTINATNISRQLSFLLIVTVAQMLVLLTAELDMSVASNIALTSIVSSGVMVAVGGDGSAAVLLGVLAGLAVGLVMGLLNGVVVARFGVPSFIVTIGTGAIAFGAALMISRGTPVTGLPAAFTGTFGTTDVGPVPLSFVIALAVCAVLYLVLNRTRLGRYLYAVGGGENAARLVGVPVFRSKVLAFVLCGMLTALAGVLLTARVSSGEANLGSEYLMLSIAAAVLGGTSFFGGEGRLGLVAVGALFLVVLSNGMNLIRVSSYTQQVVIGTLLIIAVIIDRLRNRSAIR
ncbi:ABC transporter permease [Pseudonocardia sp. H11422]|uniref:ABC transporter permease n=1 Tax=Pseudonocardia sp. H11422 TaxID=2835866 RepID=UPI001BDD05C4|nr:ABC transporter permease [Pseudonocardia sp. H11422]